MLDIQSSLGVFEGRPGELFFAYDLQALEQEKFYTAGKRTAWSVIHNGPGLQCLNASLFALMCSRKVDLTNFDLGLVQIEDETWHRIDQSCKLDPAVCCWHECVWAILGAGKGQLEAVYSCFYQHWGKTHLPENLVAFQETRSEEGSNRWEMEESTLYIFEDWLVAIEEGVVDFTFEELLIFVTGVDCLPPLGLPNLCSIEFYHQEPGIKHVPFASTCSLSLSLPRGMDCETVFRELMCLALRGSLGFGKV